MSSIFLGKVKARSSYITLRPRHKGQTAVHILEKKREKMPPPTHTHTWLEGETGKEEDKIKGKNLKFGKEILP